VVVDQDHGAATQVLVDEVLGALVKADVVDLESMADETAAADAVREGRAGAAIVIPAGFSDSVQAGSPAQIRILGGEFAVSLEVARSAVSRFVDNLGAVQLMLATDARLGGSIDPARGRGPGHDPRTGPDHGRRLEHRFAAGRPGDLLWGRDGDHVRLLRHAIWRPRHPRRSTGRDDEPPPRRADLAAGHPAWRRAASFRPSASSRCPVLVVATTVLQGRPGVHPPGGRADRRGRLRGHGISMLVGLIARHPSAGGLNAIVAISLSAIGGVFIPVSQAPEQLAQLSQITPHSGSCVASTPGRVDGRLR
jgi:ABC-2 type transport system permease protein